MEFLSRLKETSFFDGTSLGGTKDECSVHPPFGFGFMITRPGRRRRSIAVYRSLELKVFNRGADVKSQFRLAGTCLHLHSRGSNSFLPKKIGIICIV